MDIETAIETTETGELDTAAAGEGKEKLFTQEQVNEIIRKRLKNQKGMEVNAQELDARAAELGVRENRLNCKEYLLENGYNSVLLDIIDTTNVEEFKKKADTVSQMYESVKTNVAPLASLDDFREKSAAGFPDTTHIPKGYWATDPR